MRLARAGVARARSQLAAFAYIGALLGDSEAIVMLDETAELKKGTATVEVGRQHAGITGQVENCQTVVFAAYLTAHALFDFRLYLPKAWCTGRARRDRAHVPDATQFATKPALGTAMLTGAAGAGVPFAWAAAARSCAKRARRRTRGTWSRSRSTSPSRCRPGGRRP